MQIYKLIALKIRQIDKLFVAKRVWCGNKEFFQLSPAIGYLLRFLLLIELNT
jgi:hypothetical protein